MGVVISTDRLPAIKRKLEAISYFSTDRQTRYLQADDIPQHRLTEMQKNLLKKHFHTTLLDWKPKIFEEVMCNVIQSSETLKSTVLERSTIEETNPSDSHKLERISEAQYHLFDHVIFVQNLDPIAVGNTVFSVGLKHFNYKRFGFKKFFIDIWKSHFYDLVEGVQFEDVYEKVLFIDALKNLTNYITDTMNKAYDHYKIEYNMDVGKDSTNRRANSLTISSEGSNSNLNVTRENQLSNSLNILKKSI